VVAEWDGVSRKAWIYYANRLCCYQLLSTLICCAPLQYRRVNEFVWTSVPTARTEALPYHHPRWEDVQYAQSAGQFDEEA